MGTTLANFIEYLPYMFPTMFRFIWLRSFREEDFRNRPIRNKHGQWRTCLSTDQNEMSNPYRWPSINAFYHVSVHLAKQFQRRRFLEIDHSEFPVAAMFVNGSGWNEQSAQRTFQRCFSPSYGSFSQTISEENN